MLEVGVGTLEPPVAGEQAKCERCGPGKVCGRERGLGKGRPTFVTGQKKGGG